MQCQLIIVCSIVAITPCTSFLSWVWSKSSDDSVSDVDRLSLISIPFEATVEDDKFLQEASKLTDIQLSSPLEICQHKIVLKLKGSCSSMTEEELGKLSVGLLNCQSAVEGRQIFLCTENMSLKQCTINMDANMWNAYHLMSNRARAICSSVRNVQFRALSELAINKLVQSARSQIDSLNSLKKSHDFLKDTTEEVLSMIEEKNRILTEEYKYLKNAQLTAYRHIQEHLRDLYNEKSLIRSGHAQLTAMFDDIEDKIEKTEKHFTAQFLEIQGSHEELLNTLTVLHQKCLERLEKINNTIYSIENMIDTIHQQMRTITDWLNLYFDNSDNQFAMYVYISFHIFYLLGAMIIAAFLNLPFFVRLLIVILIPLNTMILLKDGMEADLDFTSITLLLFLSTIGYYIFNNICNFISFIIKKLTPKKAAPKDTQTSYFSPFKKIKSVLLLVTSLKTIILYIKKRLVQILFSKKKFHEHLNEYPSLISEDSDDNKSIHLENTLEEDEYFEHVGCRLRQKTLNNIYSLSEIKLSKSQISPELCLAKTKLGGKCRTHVKSGLLYCDRHK
ncbi:protein brambleberry-like [Chelonus insularis]|uniref:protein brambleberry-like n=1 Tax=Chelonus insularis TaxID=460826 RepID=UPI00158D367D|nr:protein brambleberry-like [Chelonus insularis]XP_034944426.1 protein brambleberry-like [Chelonus insularis]